MVQEEIMESHRIIFTVLEYLIKVSYYELVIAVYTLIPQVVSNGWNVAITKNGTVLLEGNDN